MRIVTGIHKGRKILADEDKKIRPTTSKTKQAIFSILLSRIDNLNDYAILDLCAGSGSLGLEALSRGASFCCFIDNDPQSLKYLKYNIQNLEENDRTKVMYSDVTRLPASIYKYNIVFFDPPYQSAKNILPAVLIKLHQGNWLAESAMLIIESGIKDKDKLTFNENFLLMDERMYGNTKISILSYKPIQNV